MRLYEIDTSWKVFGSIHLYNQMSSVRTAVLSPRQVLADINEFTTAHANMKLLRSNGMEQ